MPSLSSALDHLMKAKRISAPSQSYRKDNPAEYAKVVAYLEGGERPSGITTEMGMGLVEVEDVRREAVPVPPDPPDPPPVVTTPQYGVNGSKWYDSSHNPSRMVSLDARLARMEFAIQDPPSSADAMLGANKAAGIKSLLQVGFYGRIPTSAEAQGVRNWALRFGPQGTGAIDLIEFGNETSYAYQFSYPSPWYASSQYAANALSYGARAKEAALALQGTGVGLLVQGDDGGSGNSVWVNGVFSAAPEINSLIAGWTLHPYGPPNNQGGVKVDRIKANLAAKGDTSSSIFFTEWGIASDNGRTLSDNYGWPVNMTYQQAADGIQPSEDMWKTKLGNRWKLTILYQDWDQKASGSDNNREYFFGVLRNDGSAKGAYTTACKAKLAL